MSHVVCGCGTPASRSTRAVSSLSWATTSASGGFSTSTPPAASRSSSPVPLSMPSSPSRTSSLASATSPGSRDGSAVCGSSNRTSQTQGARRGDERLVRLAAPMGDDGELHAEIVRRERAPRGRYLVKRWCRTRYLAAAGACRLRHRLELVADAVARLDERVAGRAPVDLLAQAADEDVDRAVAVRLAPAPELLQQLVAGDDAAALERELVEEAELGRRQLGARGRRRTPAPRAGRSAAPRSRSARRAASPRGGSPAATPRARAPRAPSSRTASRGSRRPRSRARARGRARCRGRRRRRSACRFPRSGPSRSASSRRGREASGRARRRPASRSGAARAPACRCRPRRGRSRPRRDAAPSPARSPRRPRR